VNAIKRWAEGSGSGLPESHTSCGPTLRCLKTAICDGRNSQGVPVGK
jgi:hypothetical protein